MVWHPLLSFARMDVRTQESDAAQLMAALIAHKRGRYWLDQLTDLTGIALERLTAACTYLRDIGYIEVANDDRGFPVLSVTSRGQAANDTALIALQRDSPTFRDAFDKLRTEDQAHPLSALSGPGTPKTSGDQVVSSPRFSLTARIGSGAFGEVWKAVDSMLGRDVAVKFIRSTDATHDDVLQHARALAGVTHANIVTVYDVAKILDPDTEALLDAVIMEFIESETLHSRLERALSEADVKRIGQALIDGVRAYHVNGLAHLDLHGGNILIGELVVKLADPRYSDSSIMRSTATRGAQQAKDLRNLRDLLQQVLEVGPSMEGAQRFASATRRQPTLEGICQAFADALAPNDDAVSVMPQAPDAETLNIALDPALEAEDAPGSPQHRARLARQKPISIGEIKSMSASREGPYHVFPRADYDRIAITSRAALLVGSPELSERFIVVAQYGAQDCSLASVVKFIGSDSERTRIAPAGSAQSFPPEVLLTTPCRVERMEDGVTLNTEQGAKIAVATDGSVALRVRLANDRQGKGGVRRRGEVGLFTTLEQLMGAILYAQQFAASTADFCFRLELYPSTARLMCEPPAFAIEKHRLITGLELVDAWPDRTQQVSSAIRIAGKVRTGMGRDQFASLLDEVAHAIAVFFGVEDVVTALSPGVTTASIFEHWL